MEILLCNFQILPWENIFPLWITIFPGFTRVLYMKVNISQNHSLVKFANDFSEYLWRAILLILTTRSQFWGYFVLEMACSPQNGIWKLDFLRNLYLFNLTDFLHHLQAVLYIGNSPIGNSPFGKAVIWQISFLANRLKHSGFFTTWPGSESLFLA